jgi:hypothetical protein
MRLVAALEQLWLLLAIMPDCSGRGAAVYGICPPMFASKNSVGRAQKWIKFALVFQG